MKLYHGSYLEVKEPEILPLARALDFGQGFYLTTDFEQASKWARTSVKRRQEGEPIVNVYEFDEEKAKDLKWLRFAAPDAMWLRFVTQHRQGMLASMDYDIVSGPVANDNTMPVLNLYFKGAYTEQEAISRLLPQRLRDQVVPKTERALACLTFLEAKHV